MTTAERVLWRHIRNKQIKGISFRRQFPIDPYIVDFVALKLKVIIECDGGQHLHSLTDDARDAFLCAQGFKILRFWNDEICTHIDSVIETINKAL